MFDISLRRAHDGRPCTLLDELEALASGGLLSRFVELWTLPPTEDGQGRCHWICQAFMRAVIDAGRADGWTWCRGHVLGAQPTRMDHSWLSFDGWILDPRPSAYGIVGDEREYLAWCRPTNLVRRDARAFTQWLAKRCGARPAGFELGV